MSCLQWSRVQNAIYVSGASASGIEALAVSIGAYDLRRIIAEGADECLLDCVETDLVCRLRGAGERSLARGVRNLAAGIVDFLLPQSPVLLQPQRVPSIRWPITRKRVLAWPIDEAQGIGGDESADLGVVVAVADVEESGLGISGQALEAVGVLRGAGGDFVGVGFLVGERCDRC